MGLPAELKYERRDREGRRFDAAAIGRVLAATDQPAFAREKFLELSLFNLLIGNNDNHAKNHALLHLPGRAPMLAPFYDLVPVHMVDGFRKDLAFNLGNASYAQEVTAADLERFSVAIGIPEVVARRILITAARLMVEAIEQRSSDFPREMRALDNLFGEVAQQIDGELGLGLKLRERDAHVARGGGWNQS